MATKKISELPLITALSGSQQETLIPVVVGGLNGTTNRITAENFSKFVNAYNATTSSNTFIGAQIINGNLTVTGNQVISGRLTVNEVVAQYETASILFSTGSTKLGDELTDKHEFTGSTNITGSIIVDGNLLLNGASLNNSFERIHQATGSLQIFTASQADRNLDLSIVTGSLNQFTASQDDRNFVISQFTASTNAHIVGISDFTSSQLIVNTGLASVTASLNNFSGSTNAFTGGIERTTASIHLATASLNYFYQSTSSLNGFTASQDDRNYIISQYTSSTDAHIVGISAFTSSQLAVNLGNSIYTASVDSHIVGISTYTSSVRDTLARVHQSTASLQNFTSSQADRNLTLSTVTGSLIGITNGLMAFTAALDNTYATDAQLYQLYQSTQSLELHSGSMVGVTNGLMAYTASNSTLNTGLRGEVDGIEAYTASLKGQAIVSSSTQVQNYDVFALNSNLYTSTGSLIGITNGLMAFTAALDSTYATDAQLYQLYAETASIKAEIAGIEAYTASLKGAAIVSSSQQITNYYKFAETASANTFYGDQTITGSLAIKDSETNFLIEGNGFSQTYLTSNGAIVLNPGYGGIEMVGSYRTFKATDITADGFVSGEIRATNNVVSSSQQITEYNTFAVTSSANTFYGNQTISGSLRVTAPIRTNIISGGLDVNGGISGSFKGNLDGVAAYATTIVVANSGTTTDTSLFPTFTTSPVLASYTSLYSHASSSFFLNGVTRRVHMEGFVVSGSNNIAEISGSLIVTGSTQIIGPLNLSGSAKLGSISNDKHEITGSLNTSFGINGGLFTNDGFQKTFTFPTGNLFSIDFGSAEGGGFVDVTYGGVITSIGGRGGATRYAISYKDATNAVATKVHGYGDDIVSASISATKVAIFSIVGDAVQAAKYQVNVSVNAVAADGSGNYDKILYNRL
jgi:hypothetical protein